MRPVERGADPGPFTDYKHAAPHLRLRLGDYCSYCERQIETHLAVEHLRPKSHDPGLRNTWSNFLLACVNCNSCKCDTPINLQEYLWPDVDNTMLAFQYEPGGIITASVGLSAGLVGKAQETIRLLGLDMYPGNPGREPSISDQRWLRRQQAWQKAERYRTGPTGLRGSACPYCRRGDRTRRVLHLVGSVSWGCRHAPAAPRSLRRNGARLL